jgi:DNA-binding LacI/PurR family transcriptional regulator
MTTPNFLTITEQVAVYLRGEIMRGRWSGTIPGMNHLAPELEVDTKTVTAALRLLEKEGVLVCQGRGKPRKIAELKDSAIPTLLIAILHYEPLGQTEDWAVAIKQQLNEQGHSAFFTKKSLTELELDLRRVVRLVKQTPADAWVVMSGPLDVLTWFSEQETPVFAMFGRRSSLPIAGVGPDHVTASRIAVRRLIALGHQSIVLLVRENQREEGGGTAVRAIFEEMSAHGLPTSPYNLPHWEDSREGFHRVLEELFRITPPTALFIDEPHLFLAAKDHLAQRGILAPTHVSLICADPDPTFAWSMPSVAHTSWDHRLVVRRVMRWVNNIARGKDDRQQTLTKAEFIDGGTVGPAPRR